MDSRINKILGFRKPIRTDFGFDAKFWRVKSCNILFEQDQIEITLHGWYDQAAYQSGAKSVAAIVVKLQYSYSGDAELTLPDIADIMHNRLAKDPDLAGFVVK